MRLALKQGHLPDGSRGGLRIVVRSDDLESDREEMSRRGVAVGVMIENREESFREFRVADPDGLAITIFEWTVSIRPDPGDE